MTPGSYCVVFDSVMTMVSDAPNAGEDWKHDNPLEAVDAFLTEHKEFEVDESFNRLEVTYCQRASCGASRPTPSFAEVVTLGGARLTVLLPTYNRAASLSRTIDAVLGQTRQDLELLISDNASSDDTEAVCREYVQRDARVRYFRQPSNLGPIGNFNWLLAQPQTEFVLMLADDDWLDADYVACCLAIIERDPALSIVTGATRYFEAGARPDLVPDTNLTDAAGARRVLRYLRHSWSSAAFYGLLRNSMVKDALPIPNVMGADWLFVSALSFSGRVHHHRHAPQPHAWWHLRQLPAHRRSVDALPARGAQPASRSPSTSFPTSPSPARPMRASVGSGA